MEIWEYYYEGSTFSKHSGTHEKLPLGDKYVVMCVPRAFTPICLGEIKDAEEHVRAFKDMGWGFVFISTDSPEAWQACIAADFDKDPSFPIGTVPNAGTTDGYFDRRTVFVKDGKTVSMYQVPNEMSRNFKEIKRIAKGIDDYANSTS